jgi:hypothetical protein
MRSRSRIVVAGCLAVMLVVPAVRAYGQDVTLRYRWTKGETVRYRLTQRTMSTVTGAPGGMGEVNIEQNMIQVFRSVVDGVTAEGNATLQQVVESIRVEVSSPMGKYTFDSADGKSPASGNQGPVPGQEMMGKIFAAMVGEAFSLELSPTGQVLKVEGIQRVLDKMMSELPKDQMSAQMMSNLKQNFSDDAMKNTFSQGFAQLPDHPLKPGDSWTSSATVVNPAMGKLSTSTTSTLQPSAGASSSPARILTKISMTQESPSANPMGITMRLDSASGDGELLFDVAKGRFQGGTTKLTMPLMMTGSTPDGSQLNMTTLTKTTITIELIP